jgi:CRP-like cAMP-binding protein
MSLFLQMEYILTRGAMKDLKAAISQHRLFHGLNERYIDLLTRHACDVHFDTDQILFREGEVAWQFYLIQTGRVVLESSIPPHGILHIQFVPAGEVLGWSWLFPPFHWHFQARAAEPTDAIYLDGCRLLIACEEDHNFGYELMKRITQVLIHRLEAGHKRLLELQQEARAIAA